MFGSYNSDVQSRRNEVHAGMHIAEMVDSKTPPHQISYRAGNCQSAMQQLVTAFDSKTQQQTAPQTRADVNNRYLCWGRVAIPGLLT